jgi:hypothetical protein
MTEAPQPCPDCAAWAADPVSSLYRTGCEQCTARHVARSQAAWMAWRRVTDDPFLAALQRHWPGDEDRGKRLVWVWMKRLRIVG